MVGRRSWFFSETMARAIQSQVAGGGITDRGKIFIERFKGCQELQHRLRPDRFDDQLFTLFAYDRVISGEFERARNSHRLVAADLKEFYATFRTHALAYL